MARRAKRTTLDPLRIVCVGPFGGANERVLDHLKVARLLKKASVDFKLTMIGEGDAYNDLATRSTDLIVSGQMNMPGRISAEGMVHVFRDADIFLSLSDHEKLPIPLLNAMCYGVVPIIWDTSNLSSEIVSGQDGYLVPKNSFSALVNLLASLQLKPKELFQASIRAEKYSQGDDRNIDRMVDKYIEIVESVIAELQTATSGRC
jgi:glycosyltransferase involved in cell wall biosynthesis